MSSLSGALGAPPSAGGGRSLCDISRGIGAISLLGLVGSSLAVVLIASERPSFLAPVSRPGFFPAWMVGPLRGCCQG